MLSDQQHLRRRLLALKKSDPADRRYGDRLRQLQQQVMASASRRRQRQERLPAIGFAEELPVSRHQAEIVEAIKQHQVLILAGETGSGKTTQLPKICLAAGRGISGLIGHTQPRRIAARSVATRIAQELNTPLGAAVGYKVRFADHVHDDAYIKLMTDGILLAELQGDRQLNQYDTLIIDEAHERSLNIDFLLGYVKKLLPRRKDLKLIITSATIDTGRFSRHFDDAPVIEVSGRTYPVEMRYRPLALADDEEEMDLCSGVLAAVDELAASAPAGDTLVFLSGESEIREVAEALRKHHPPATEVLPLFSRLSASEQNRIFQPARQRRIILATNVAETSLTVPGIRYVIDPGKARISRYSHHNKVQRLPIEKISRSSADQRAGRCGRVSDGICIRLYSEEDYLARPLFTSPEIQRTNLAAVILQMRQLNLGNPEEFPFIDAPDKRYINDGLRLLNELAVIDEHQHLTPLGRNLARLPVDPRIGRMVLAASEFDCLQEVLIIASALSIQDPRERPADKQQKADQCHAAYRDEESDFISLLNLWRDYQDKQKHLSHNQLRKHCRNQFLSYLRMKEWKETQQQLRAQVKNLGMKINQHEASYEQIHRALLTGLLGNIGVRDDADDKAKAGKKPARKAVAYLGARNTQFYIFPGSALAKKKPRWLMAAELVETSRLYARVNARIELEWIEPAAQHLLKRSYSEPYWNEKRGQVCVYESVALNGLLLCGRRRAYYGNINPVLSREIFIREALVNGRLRSSAAFHLHNRALIEEAFALEDKIRRRDVFSDEEKLFEFFAARLPENICTVSAFERWRKRVEKQRPDILYLQREHVFADDGALGGGDYPGEIMLNEVLVPLSYCFNPAGEDDGVTATIPLGAINQLQDECFEWLVPGFLLEKVTAVLKGLPKALRKQLVPIPDKAKIMLREIRAQRKIYDGGLMEVISETLNKDYAIRISAHELRKIELAAHLRFRYCISGQPQVVCGRDLQQLRRELSVNSKPPGQQQAEASQWPQTGITRWDFGELPEFIEVARDASRYRVFPALVDQGDSVGVHLFDAQAGAESSHRQGLVRLVMLGMAKDIKYLRRKLPHMDTMCMQYMTLAPCAELREEVLARSVAECFFADHAMLRNEIDFQARVEKHRASLTALCNALCELLSRILREYHNIQQFDWSQYKHLPAEIVRDVQQQLSSLVYKGFVLATPENWLQQMPRYLSALQLRLQKLAINSAGDVEKMQRLQPFLLRFAQLSELKDINPQQLVQLRWMLEEYRVSLFAQKLKTSIPVSPQRIEKQIQLCLGRS